MQVTTYQISEKLQLNEDTYIFRLTQDAKQPFPFTAGQFVFLTNPKFSIPSEPHPFSIASSPSTQDYLEFCVRVYGDWTGEFVKLDLQDTVGVSEPRGVFTWNETIKDAVFLCGGTGIPPLMSILRYIKDTKQTPNITMLYGNRTHKTAIYHDELTTLPQFIPHFRLVDIFSHLESQDQWQGYRGFITKDIIIKEVDVSKKPIFFVVGPPTFITEMLDSLSEYGVKKEDIKTEHIAMLPAQ